MGPNHFLICQNNTNPGGGVRRTNSNGNARGVGRGPENDDSDDDQVYDCLFHLLFMLNIRNASIS